MRRGFFQGKWLEFGDEQRYIVCMRICKQVGPTGIRRCINYWYSKSMQVHNLYLWPVHILWRIGPYLPRPSKKLAPSPVASKPGSADASTS